MSRSNPLHHRIIDIGYGPYLGHPMDPRTPDLPDDILTEDDAHEQASDEVGCTPYGFVWWLQENALVDAALTPVATQKVTDYPPEATLPQLVALLMAGTEKQVINAVYELRDRFMADKATQSLIAERADELLQQARLAEPEADPYVNDPHFWF